MRIRLSDDKLAKILVGHRERDISFLALGRRTLAHGTGFLEVEIPLLCLAGFVLEVEGEDGAAGFDGVFAGGIRGEGLGDGVEGDGGGEGVCRWGLVSGEGERELDTWALVPCLRDMMAVCMCYQRSTRLQLRFTMDCWVGGGQSVWVDESRKNTGQNSEYITGVWGRSDDAIYPGRP